VLPFFSQIAGNWETRPIPGLCPFTELSDFRLSDNLTPHHHRGAGTTGHWGVGLPPLFQIAGHVEQRGANKKLTKVYPRHESARQNN